MNNFLKDQGLDLARGKIEIKPEFKSVRLDVGLSVNAPQSQIWIEKDDSLFVFGFEPISKNIESILSGNSPWPVNLNPIYVDSRMKILKCALLDIDYEEEMEMFVTRKDPGCSSLLEPKSFEVSYKEKVRIFSLNSFLKFFPFEQIPYISHLKIDVQGSDFQVLQGADKFLSKIMAVTLEVDTHEYKNTQNSLPQIEDYLKKRGFLKIKKSLLSQFTLRMKGVYVKSETDDPSFINVQLYRQFQPKNFWIYQRG